MNIKISYKNSLSKRNSSNVVLFIDEKFNISGLKKLILDTEYSFIFDLLKTKDINNKILTFDISSKKK